MSFTVYHTKRDGSKEAIKMSIFDAFRGVPDPKPKKAKERLCPCCGKPHDSKTEAPDRKKSKDSKAGDKDRANSEGKDGEETNDQIILRMKAENPQAQWEDIFAATTGFKNKHEVKGRYKELMEKEKTGEKENSKGAAAGNKEDNGDDKDAKRARKKEEGLRKQAEAKAKREAEQNAKSKEAGEDGKNEKNDKKGKDHKSQRKWDNKHKGSESDKSAFKAWADDYDKKKWQILASKHYDRTGKRITAAEARKMAEGK